MPILLGALAAGFVAVWLARSLAGISLLFAATFWAATLAGLAFSSGGLPWVDRHPALDRLLRLYAPPLVSRDTAVPTASFTDDLRWTAPPAAMAATPQKVDISNLLGVGDIRAEIDAIADESGLLVRSGAPAVFVVLAGPPGTGKTEMARYMANRLHQNGVAKTGSVIAISEADVSGFGDGSGAIAERVRKAVDGVLLLDGLDEIVANEDTRRAADVRGMSVLGTCLLSVANQYRKRLIVIWTGSAEAAAALDMRGRWLGKLEQRYVTVPHMTAGTRKALALRLFDEKGFLCAPEATPEIARRLGNELEEELANCDNFHAVQRYVNSAIEAQKMRLRREERDARERGNILPLADRSLIKRADLDAASPKVTR